MKPFFIRKTTSNDNIRKENIKKLSTLVNFSNLWLRLSNQKPYHERIINLKNKMLKNEIEKKNFIKKSKIKNNN